MLNEEITAEEWKWAMNVSRRWKKRMRRYGTLLDDEIDSAAIFGIMQSIIDKEKATTCWKGFLHINVEWSIFHAIKKWNHDGAKKHDRQLGYENPYDWPRGVYLKEDGEDTGQLEFWYNGDQESYEQSEEIHVKLQQIDPELKEVLRRYFWDGQYCKDIGKDLGVHLGTAARMIEKGKQQLKEKLEPCLS